MSINNKWVSLWGNAVSITENRPESYSKDITLRYPIYSAFSGDSIKITLDNYCGTDVVSIGEATIFCKDKFYEITFDGSKNLKLQAKERVTSDPINMNVTSSDTIVISIYLDDFTQMRSSVFISGPLSGGQYSLGNQTKTPVFSIDTSRKTNIYYFLSNVEILTSENNRSIVCYGDSITAQAWPDYLTLRCKDIGANHTAIIRRATSGSRILREYDNITYESYGLKGVNRFDHEVPTTGADTVIIQQGINDIIHPVGTEINPFRPMSDLPTANELIDGLKWYIERARSYGYKVYVGTLIPIKGWRTYEDFREILKNEYNDFIRQTDLIDGCIDFDMALRDKKDPAAFIKEYDSGDHLHPSLEGYKAMADTVPQELLW